MHELFRGIPDMTFLVMVVVPLAMSVAAVALGWQARQSARQRRHEAPHPATGIRGPGEDALGAGITVAVVPLAFALMVLWARFG